MIYCDSSALLKLVFQEDESDGLEGWIGEQSGETLVSSDLARVEIVRAVRRLNASALPAARALLRQVDLVPLSEMLIDSAWELEDPRLRTLDALHLASALALGEELSAFVAYDHRLTKAAERAGLTTLAPGA